MMNPLSKIIYAVILQIFSLSEKYCVRAVSLVLAVVLIAGGFCVPAASADEDTANYCKMSFELYPEGKTTEKNVTLNGIMPKNASAKAVDVTEHFTDISEDNPNAPVIAAYDITITDGKKEYQPDNDKPIQVEITNPVLSEERNFELWHIKDSGEKEKIEHFSVENGKISFTATGFSVYAIVDVSSPYEMEEISSIDDLEGSRATAGFCLYYGNHKFFTNSLNGSGALTETNDGSSAAVWFFTKTGNYYKISTMINGVEKFIHTKSGNEIELSENNADLFQITSAPNNTFYLKNSIENKWLQHSGSGNGIRYYQSNSNAVNSRIKMVFADTMTLPDDWYHLNGKSYGLMNYSGGTLGNAFMAQENENYLSMLSLNVRRETGSEILYVAEDSDITMWTFHYISDTDYKISTTVNGETKYLHIGDTLSLVGENQASLITVSTDSQKHLKLSANGKSVAFGENGFVSAVTADNSSQLLHLVKSSELTHEDYITYYADKVSISNVADGAGVIVYTRVWNDSTKAYDFYAVDHDGTLYPCYERGDHLTWVGTKINTLLWNFTEYHYDDGTPNYYYELYNPYSHKYIAPQIQDGQTLSDNKIGINLSGRRYGDYYSDILAWDTPYYAYAGLQSDIESGRIAAGPKAEADTFYFAVVEKPTSSLSEVNTINNSDYGITMKMIDFPVQPDSAGHSLQNEFLGTDDKSCLVATPGLLSTDIDSATGYPKSTCSGTSLSELFSCAEEVNHLFLESIYKASGYFEFDSTQNFATLIQPDGTVGSDFTVYKELGTADAYERTTLKHGQFFPYNTITAGVYAVKNSQNLYSALAQYGNEDLSVGELPEDDPRKYERLHLVNGKPNYYNGMEMTARMVQSPDGKDSWGHDIVFEFTGDDDFWFYVDNELVIDLGGIHSALHGNVNFATGKVIVDGTETNLRTVFRNNYCQRNPNATTEEINAFLVEYFDGEETVFKDYTTHSVRIFYMERGAGASNLHMRFNLEPVTPGNVLLTKKISGSEDIDFNLVEYPFQIWYKDESGNEYLLTNDNHFRVSYQNSIQRVNYAVYYTPPNSSVTYNSVYFLNPGKSAEIQFPANTGQYRIVECGVNQEVYDTVNVNGTAVTGTAISGTDRKSYDSGWLNIGQRPVIVFDNHVNPASLRTLSFTKKLFDESGNELTAEQDSTGFNFRLYLSNGTDNTLNLANMVKYYVTAPNGMLCTWDSVTQSFVASEQSDYFSLTSEQKAPFTFETSMYGAISKIPAGYSVEVPNIPVGTKFRVIERENEIPVGYRFQSYERIGGSYHAEDGDTLNSGWVRANESPKMIVNNKRGWSIEVNKIWSDKDFTARHAPVFVAVYCGDTLVPDTVSCIAHPSASKRYFFDSLPQGVRFEDYKVYEIEPDNPVVENGELISCSGIRKRLENGDLTDINAVANNENTPVTHSYAVTYHYGTPASQAHGTNVTENVRNDTITNTRTDGIVITLYDMHTREPLADGKFTLMQGDTLLGTFISDSQGRITVFYNFERNTDYTLIETEPPQYYIGLPNAAVFSIGDNNSVTISGNKSQWQEGRTAESGDNFAAYIDVYNKPFTLTAIKVDCMTGKALSGAHFALYRSVSGIDGAVKDLEPIPGYADLVSDSNGIIPGIDKTLEPGKYYLTETIPPADHDAHEEDIIFTVFRNGMIHIDSIEHGDYLTIEGTDECNYIFRIENERSQPIELIITKTVTGNFGDKTKEFTFTLSVENAETTDEYMWSKNGIPQTESLHNNATFTLKHGDSVKIMLPVNANITVTENNQDYSTSFKLNDTAATAGNTKTFRLVDESVLRVTNRLDTVIPTGRFQTGVGIEILIMAGFCLFMFLAILRCSHYKKLTA